MSSAELNVNLTSNQAPMTPRSSNNATRRIKNTLEMYKNTNFYNNSTKIKAYTNNVMLPLLEKGINAGKNPTEVSVAKATMYTWYLNSILLQAEDALLRKYTKEKFENSKKNKYLQKSSKEHRLAYVKMMMRLREEVKKRKKLALKFINSRRNAASSGWFSSNVRNFNRIIGPREHFQMKVNNKGTPTVNGEWVNHNVYVEKYIKSREQELKNEGKDPKEEKLKKVQRHIGRVKNARNVYKNSTWGRISRLPSKYEDMNRNRSNNAEQLRRMRILTRSINDEKARRSQEQSAARSLASLNLVKNIRAAGNPYLYRNYYAMR